MGEYKAVEAAGGVSVGRIFSCRESAACDLLLSLRFLSFVFSFSRRLLLLTGACFSCETSPMIMMMIRMVEQTESRSPTPPLLRYKDLSVQCATAAMNAFVISISTSVEASAGGDI